MIDYVIGNYAHVERISNYVAEDQAISTENSVILHSIINVFQTFNYLLILIGLIIGITFMIKSKKSKIKKFLIGFIIIAIPFIINFALIIIKLNM